MCETFAVILFLSICLLPLCLEMLVDWWYRFKMNRQYDVVGRQIQQARYDSSTATWRVAVIDGAYHVQRRVPKFGGYLFPRWSWLSEWITGDEKEAYDICRWMAFDRFK